MQMIKRHMTKRNIPCTLRTLETGLVKPLDLSTEQINVLPKRGGLLMDNPLENKAKKGKKSKKGKKKSKM